MPKQKKEYKEPVGVIGIRKSTFEALREYCQSNCFNQTDIATKAIDQFLSAQESGEAQKLRETMK